MNKLVITLSGEICSKGSTDLEGFWNGFINIQRSICNIDDLQVVGHSMNPTYDDLVKNVYGIKLLSSVPQSKDISSNNTTKLYIDLAEISSKKKSLMLLEKLNVDSDTWVLSTRWDTGYANTQFIKPITFDYSLPKAYLYLAYNDDVDEGYSTSWCYSSYENLKYLFKYEEYLVDILSSDSNSLEKYTNNPWPLAIKKNDNKWSSLKRIVFTAMDGKVNFQAVRNFIPILSKRINGLEYRLKKVLEKPIVTGENSLLSCSDTNVLLSDYSEGFSERSLFKSFILESGLREKIRFLESNDFERASVGQMINPISFACVIYSHSDFSACWEVMLEQALRYLPVNCSKIYVISEGSEKTDVAFSKLNKKGVDLITYKDGGTLAPDLHNAFIKINDTVEYIYFIKDNTPFISSVDAIFLNSLLHFLDNTSDKYVQLSGRHFLNEDVVKEPFPCIVKQASNCPLFSQPVILKSSCLIKQLASEDGLASNIEDLLTGSNISFSVVCDRLNSEVLSGGNRFFPHAHVSIPLQIDDKNEWKKYIELETDEYEKIKIQVG
jgi:hypothetical protein